MSLGLGVLTALLLQMVPGVLAGRAARLTWPVAIVVGPALTYGVVAAAIVPFGAVGIPWNAWTALAALAVALAVLAGLRTLLARYRDDAADAQAASRRPALVVAGGVLLGALLIAAAALAGMPHWQSIPSTWDAVWHANTVRFILDTGQASPTHMGELRNVETHAPLYYPSAFHALTAVQCQLTGAAPTTAYTLQSLAAAIWLFPVSAAVLTWRMVRPVLSQARTAGAAATAAVLAASFTAVPYIEFGTAAMPNLVAYGLAAPVFALITSTPAHRDRIPAAVLALFGALSVHLTGGVVAVTLVAAWWLLAALRHPVRSRRADLATLAGLAAATGLALLPQLLSVRKQADIIAGHSFLSYLGQKRNLFDAIFQHTRHLNDFPVQQMLIALAAIGALILLAKRVWWPLAVWAGLIALIVHAAEPLGGPLGSLLGPFGDLFYNDPRRLSAVVTLLLAPMAGIALFTVVAAAVAGPVRARVTAVLLAVTTLAAVVVTVHSVAPVRGPLKSLLAWVRHLGLPLTAVLGILLALLGLVVLAAVAVVLVIGSRRLARWLSEHPAAPPRTAQLTAAVLVITTVALGWHYFPRHRFLLGDKYDSVIVDQHDLDAYAYLAGLPDAHNTVIGDANTDGSAWMYAVADLHPLWTHYDFPVQQGPGPNRFLFWAHADDADTDPDVVEAIHALNIRYVLISGPIVRGFKLPDGLVSLDKSKSWAKIYDKGGVSIYEWRGPGAAVTGEH